MEPLSRTITGPPSGTRVEQLPDVPGLGRLYARGAVGSLRARLPLARAGSGALPAVAYLVDGIVVDAAHLTAYQHLLHESGSDALPSGYLHVLAFPVATAVMVRDDFPLPLLGMVHVANAASLLRPVTLGDQLDITAWTQDLRPHRRGTQLDVVAEVAVDGEVAWRGVSTYLAKHEPRPEAGSARPSAEAGSARPSAEVGGSTRGRGLYPPNSRATPYLEELSGAETRDGGGVRWVLGGDVGRRYGAVSGDRNPIHMSALSAKAFGFPRAIAHGMYTAARALADVGPRRGDTYDWTVDFAKPVLLPGRVDVAYRTAADGTVTYAAASPSGKPHLTGTVTPT